MTEEELTPGTRVQIQGTWPAGAKGTANRIAHGPLVLVTFDRTHKAVKGGYAYKESWYEAGQLTIVEGEKQ